MITNTLERIEIDTPETIQTTASFFTISNAKDEESDAPIALLSALSAANILYCTPQQLIGGFEGEADLLLPKYKIAIGLNQPPHLLQNDWESLHFGTENVEKSISDCLRFIKNRQQTHKYKFTFVDLFAGVGGFRIPLEALGGRCLGFSEIDKKAIETYKTNFFDTVNPDELELGSVTQLGKLPFENIDLIVGGVPCQSWSVAGKMRGFDDPRGKLWEDTIRIVELNQPKTFRQPWP